MSRRREKHAHADDRPSRELGTEGLSLFEQRPIDAAPPAHQRPVRAHMRRVTSEPVPTGAQRRDDALAKHQEDEAVQIALEYVRAKLAALYTYRFDVWERRMQARSRPNDPRDIDPYVTADDADQILREWAECPPSIYERPNQNWRGSLFRGRGWEKTGRYVKSGENAASGTRDHMHATDLPCWRYVERTQAGAA